MKIYCCACQKDVEAVLVSGYEVYPHRSDLFSLPFWQCPTCKNFVGCHHKSRDKTRPLGVIATQTIKNLRIHIHNLMDPIWQRGRMNRSEVYAKLGAAVGRKYHTADLRSEAECLLVIDAAKSLLARAGAEQEAASE